MSEPDCEKQEPCGYPQLDCVLGVYITKCEDRIEALEAKLAAAVDWFETIRDRAKGDYMAHTYYLDALAALATIEKSDAP